MSSFDDPLSVPWTSSWSRLIREEDSTWNGMSVFANSSRFWKVRPWLLHHQIGQHGRVGQVRRGDRDVAGLVRILDRDPAVGAGFEQDYIAA